MKLIITGASGMVGEEVLREALEQRSISAILVIGRRPCGVKHEKLKELLHQDFFNIRPLIDELTGYDACLFCLGVSSVGMKEPEFFKLTHTLTLHFADFFYRANPGKRFCYISGAGTDSTEQGRQMWARVKGKTENDLQKIGGKGVFFFRPGYLQPTSGMLHTLKYYRYIKWMYPFFNLFFSSYVSTLRQLAKAMIFVADQGYQKPLIEVSDIRYLSVQYDMQNSS